MARTNDESCRAAISVLLALALALGMACQAAAGGVATVTNLSGTLLATKPDGTTRILARSSEVVEGEVLSTAASSYARIKFADGGELILRPRSQVKIEMYRFEEAKPEEDNVTLELFKGGVRGVTGLIGKRNRPKYRMKVQNATIGIRGTNYGVLLCRDAENDCVDVPTISGKPPQDGLHVDVASGAVAVENKAGIQAVAEGQFAYVKGPDTPPALKPPEEGVRVTLPPFMASAGGGGATIGAERQDNACVIK